MVFHACRPCVPSFSLSRRGVCACTSPRPPAQRCGSPLWVPKSVGRLAQHAARPPCAVLATAGRPRVARLYVVGLCPTTRLGVSRVALRSPRVETELTDVSSHPRTPVPLRCAKGGCGRVKFSKATGDASESSALEPIKRLLSFSISSLSLYASPGPPTHPHPTRNYHSPHHPAAPPSRRKDNCRGRMCKPTHPPRRSAMPGQFLGQVTLRVCLLNVCQVGTPLGPPERHKMNSRPFREFLRGFASLLAREEAGPRLVSSGPFPRTRVIPAFPHFS